MSIFGNYDMGPKGGEYNGFVGWSSQGSDDGTIPRRSFSLNVKDANGQNHRTPWGGPQQGIALDIRKLKVGWELNEQNMPKPQRQFVQFGQQFPVKPGDGWKKALSVPVTTGDGNVYLWEQGGVTAFSALELLVPKLAAQEAMNPGKVPVVQYVAAHEFSVNGKLLAAAILEPVQWVDPVQFFGAAPIAQAASQTGLGYDQHPNSPGFGGQPQQQQQPAQQPAQGGFGGQPAQGGGFGGQPAQQTTQGGGFGGQPAQQQPAGQQPVTGAFAGGPVGQTQNEF